MLPIASLSANPLSSDAEKNSEEFGLKVLRGCWNRWKNGYGGETYVNRVARITKNRLYAMGKQPCEQFRDQVIIEGQHVVVNLDYSPLAIAVPLLNAKTDRYMQREEKITCKAFGPVSQNKKKKDKDEAKFKLNYGDAVKKLQGDSGLQLEEFSDTDPKSEQELNIKFKTTYKQKEEIIMQMGMELVFDQNEWQDVIKAKLLQDQWSAGYCITQTELNGNGWIKTPWVRPESFITSYSEYDDFRDWQWQGQRLSMSITEIRMRYPDKYTEDKLWELANRFKGKYNNANDCFVEWNDLFYTAVARPYDQVSCELVDLYYKTLYNLKYRTEKLAYGREKIYFDADKEFGHKPNIEQSKPYYVAYHGVWIIDTDEVLEWGMAKNMLKPNNNLVEIRSPYSIHMYGNVKCRNTPLVETMIPLIDLMQNIHLQTQKIIAMTAPDGFNIDVLGLSNMDMGEGVGVISPMQAFGIYLQTGNQYYRSKEPDDDTPSQPPIQPQNNQYSNKLEQLEKQWQATYQKLQVITGDNNLAQGQISNGATANSTLNDAREIADNASNYAYKSYLSVFKATAKNVELLLLDKFMGLDNSFDGYNMALGEEDIEYLRNLANEDLASLMFDTKIEVALDSADKARWDNFINIALEQKQITVADVAMLDMITDQTYRSFMFAQAVKQNQAMQAQIAAQNSQNNVMQNKAAAQEKGAQDLAAGQQDHNNKMAQIEAEQNSKQMIADINAAATLKGKIIDNVLSNPNATLESIPPFIWETLHTTDKAQQQLILQSMQMKAQPPVHQQQPPQQQQQPPQQQQQAA